MMTTLSEFMACTDSVEGFVTAQLTDQYILDYWPMKNESLVGKEGKILEVRVFNKDKEYKLFRADLLDDFKIRLIDESEIKPKKDDYFDQKQFLDIDTARSHELFQKKHRVKTTTGGDYYLPLDSFDKMPYVVVRQYFGINERNGQAFINDYRLVDLKED